MRLSRLRTRPVLLVASVAFVALALAGCLPPPPPPPPPPAPPGAVTVMGPARLTADQLVAFVQKRGPKTTPYRAAGATLSELAAMFISEGNRYGVRGDVAFAQSIVETGWFSYPDNGIVRPTDNNFAGMGACTTCGNGYGFTSALSGVRAQIQLLRNYADATSLSTTIPDPPVPELWSLTPSSAYYNFDHYSHKGKAPLWDDMGNGNWATSSTYGKLVLQIYGDMLTDNGLPTT